MKVKKYLIGALLISNMHGALNTALPAGNKEMSANDICPLLIKNNSGSPIWISHGPLSDKKITFEELEQSGNQQIQPYEVEAIPGAQTFNVLTRTPQSNNLYHHSLTVVQRTCDPSNNESVIDFSALESGQADPSRFIVINHTKEKEVPESAHRICPGGQLPEFDSETDQWFCKVYRYSNVYEKFVDEYVPVLSYIYQWLPPSIWVEWYIKNPQFYNWYHHYPEFYNHLPHYQAPWQTTEYATWYDAQPKKIRSSLPKPEPLESAKNDNTLITQNPLGFPENKIKRKTPSLPSHILQKPGQMETPPIAIHTKKIKKQELEDIISSDLQFVEPAIKPSNVKKEEKKEKIPAAHVLNDYDRTINTVRKPAAINRRGIITSHRGIHQIVI